MAKSIKDAKDSKEFLAVLTGSVGKIIPVESADLFLIDKRSGNIAIQERNRDRFLNSRVQSFIEEGIVDWVIEEKRVVIIEDLDFAEREIRGIERNFSVIPLVYEERGCGIFLVYTSKRKDELTHQDTDRIMKIADEGAQALHKMKK
ncbi:GAF domain-containing protein [candidate division KSB1 bacterium]